MQLLESLLSMITGLLQMDFGKALAARKVFAAMTEIRSSVAAVVLPALNPNHPNRRIRAPEYDERDAVARDASGLAVGSELARSGAEDQCADERHHSAHAVDDARAGEVGGE